MQILDEVLIANECVGEMKAKGRKGIVYKMDLEKAYDYFNWDFLDYVLCQKGLDLNGESCFFGYISSVHYVVLINCTSRGFFGAKWGPKQGDPLSLFLCTMVADILSCLIRRPDL